MTDFRTSERTPFTTANALAMDLPTVSSVVTGDTMPTTTTDSVKQTESVSPNTVPMAQAGGEINDPLFTFEMPAHHTEDGVIDLRLRQAKAITDGVLEVAKQENKTDRESADSAVSVLKLDYISRYEAYKSERDTAFALAKEIYEAATSLANATFETSVQSKLDETSRYITQIQKGVARSDALFAAYELATNDVKSYNDKLSLEQVQYQAERDQALTNVYEVMDDLVKSRDELEKGKRDYSNEVKKHRENRSEYKDLYDERARLRAEENKERAWVAQPTVQQLSNINLSPDDFKAAKSEFEMAVNTPEHPKLYSKKLQATLENIEIWKKSFLTNEENKGTIETEIERIRAELVSLDKKISRLINELSNAQDELGEILATRPSVIESKSIVLRDSSEAFSVLKAGNLAALEGMTIPDAMKPLVQLTTEHIIEDADEGDEIDAITDPHIFYTDILEERKKNKATDSAVFGQLRQLPGFIRSAVNRAREHRPVITFVPLTEIEAKEG